MRVDGLLEHERDAPALERARGQAVAPSARARARAGAAQLVRRKLRACQEVPCQCESSAGTSTTGATSRPTRRCSRTRSRLLRVTERNATHVQVNRPLLRRSSPRWIAGHEWDVALLQEAPPRWFRALGRRGRARTARSCSPRATSLPAAAAAARRPQPRPARVEARAARTSSSCARRGGSSSTATHDARARAPSGAGWSGRAWSCPAGDASAWPTCTPSAGLPDARPPASCCARPRERRRLVGAATRSCFGGDLNLRPARDPEAFARAARALRPRRPHRAARDRPPARARARGRRERPRRLPAGGARAARAGRPAHPALRPRARRRARSGEIVLVRGMSQSTFAGLGGEQMAERRSSAKFERRSEVDRGRRTSSAAQGEQSRGQRLARSRPSATRPAREARPRRATSAAAQRRGQEGRQGARAPAEGAKARPRRRTRATKPARQRRRRGQDGRRVPRGAAQEPDPPAGDGDAHARAHRGGAERGGGARPGDVRRRAEHRVRPASSAAASRRTTC